MKTKNAESELRLHIAKFDDGSYQVHSGRGTGNCIDCSESELGDAILQAFSVQEAALEEANQLVDAQIGTATFADRIATTPGF